MEKIKKGFNFKILSLIISTHFLFTGILYSHPVSEDSLRVPVGQVSKRMEEVTEAQNKISPTTLALERLEQEWNDIFSDFKNNKVILDGDTFSCLKANTVLRNIIEADVLKARKGNKELTYIISCGQNEDVSMLINALSESIPEKEKPLWTISIIVTNIKSESLEVSKKIISDLKIKFNLPMCGYYIIIDITNTYQANALNKLLSKHDCLGIADGIMHNMGRAYIEPSLEYYKMLRSFVKEGSWFQIDTKDLQNAKEGLRWTPEDPVIVEARYKYTLETISELGFSTIGGINQKYKPFVIFKAVGTAYHVIREEMPGRMMRIAI